MSPPATRSASRAALALGLAAGPLYVVTGLVQVLLREGFDVRRHALSHLSNGEHGWIQVANFIASGTLVIVGALGCRVALRAQRAGTWGPILLGVFGFGLIGAGIFPADPAGDFPPGVERSSDLSTAGLLHFVFGAIGFYALIAACFVFASRFARLRRRSMAWYSTLTGAGFFASFAAIASGSSSPAVLITFYVAVVWIWAWHTIVLRDLRALHVAVEDHRAAQPVRREGQLG